MNWLVLALPVLVALWFIFPTGTRGGLNERGNTLPVRGDEGASVAPQPRSLSPLNDRLAQSSERAPLLPERVALRQPKEGAPGETSGAPDGRAAA